MEGNNLKDYDNNENQIISTWEYVGIILIMGIPVIGLIFIIVWACGGCKKKSKTNMARALLLLGVFGLITTFIIGFLVKNVVIGLVEEIKSYPTFNQDYEYVEDLWGEDVSIKENLEEPSEPENVEEVVDFEGLLGLEGLENLEGLIDMGNLLGVDSLDELEGIIGSEYIDNLESMIDMDSLGDLQNLDESDIMGIINELDEDDWKSITQILESLGVSIE